MTHPSLARLTALVPPPSTRRSPDWSPVEAALGSPLPDDYKRIIETYGGGVFDETIWVLEPGCSDEDYDLLAEAEACGDALAGLWAAGEPQPAALRAEGARVIPWAYVEGAGHYLYWLAGPGQEPAEWTVLLNEGRGPEWEHHALTCAGFLVGVLTGEVESCYVGGLADGPHTFTPNADIL
ncbi:SMI1/KNR4 family protein [Streptomyces sp. NPDC045431]|uniref:SMI1/KNR4 family protein n=1 Tax=Streptomyces sp. NPDC045431 TaxID=3155613 RepID=UPI0033EF733B